MDEENFEPLKEGEHFYDRIGDPESGDTITKVTGM